MNTRTFNASELSSRKRWQLVNNAAEKQVDDDALAQAISELAMRRRYLEELQEIGRLEDNSDHP